MERIDNEDCPDARPNRPDAQPSRPDVVVLWEESRYFGKAVAEDRPDEANFRLDAPQWESKFV
jgi:hypothetical protein